ncbi:MAG: hypothetical protein C5B55_04035 [Blastocatellia bacterium]|nr:MAG: hypothetical protein C5B55_04035 [Blastocatellia bacterium]
MKTNKTLIFSAALILASITTFGQTAPATKANANKTWTTFWQRLVSAANKKDHKAMLAVMPADFFDGGGGGTASEWLKDLDARAWRDLQKSFAKGTKPGENDKSKAIVTRVTRDNAFYFEFRKDGKWWFAGVMGD